MKALAAVAALICIIVNGCNVPSKTVWLVAKTSGDYVRAEIASTNGEGKSGSPLQGCASIFISCYAPYVDTISTFHEKEFFEKVQRLSSRKPHGSFMPWENTHIQVERDCWCGVLEAGRQRFGKERNSNDMIDFERRHVPVVFQRGSRAYWQSYTKIIENCGAYGNIRSQLCRSHFLGMIQRALSDAPQESGGSKEEKGKNSEQIVGAVRFTKELDDPFPWFIARVFAGFATLYFCWRTLSALENQQIIEAITGGSVALFFCLLALGAEPIERALYFFFCLFV